MPRLPQFSGELGGYGALGANFIVSSPGGHRANNKGQLRRQSMGKYVSVAPANSFDRWPEGLREELQANAMNPIVGSVLVSETDALRVWHLLVPAGQRCTFHRHVLDYFWTCRSHGRARGYYEDGSITETTHYPGDTMHLSYGPGEY